MKYSKPERLDIGRRIYEGELTRFEAAEEYGMTYLSGLTDLLKLKAQHPEYQMILHSNQGAVYSSKSFNELLPMYGIVHSMSRAGTPTDNAAMESINGWIKAEIFTDLHITGERPIETEVDDYIRFFKEERPSFSLNYLTPRQYRESYALNRGV